MEYRHTQQAFVPLAMWIGFVIVLGIIVPTEEWGPWAGIFPLAITLIMLLFSRLTVTVTSEIIVISFGLGWPKHTETISGVLAAHEVRNSWIQGWGIRKISGGWMYNVSGYDAVELDLASGKKFRIGTDDPTNLAASIAIVLPPTQRAN
jgi:hypothetical protein